MVQNPWVSDYTRKTRESQIIHKKTRDRRICAKEQRYKWITTRSVNSHISGKTHTFCEHRTISGNTKQRSCFEEDWLEPKLEHQSLLDFLANWKEGLVIFQKTGSLNKRVCDLLLREGSHDLTKSAREIERSRRKHSLLHDTACYEEKPDLPLTKSQLENPKQ